MNCAPIMALILTDVQSLSGAPLTHAGVPVAYMTLDVAAALVGVAKKTIRNDLSEFKDRFDCATYRRSRGTIWNQRLITAHDLQVLRGMYPLLSSYKR